MHEWNEQRGYFSKKEPILIYDEKSDFLKRDMEEKVLVKCEVSRQRWNLLNFTTEE